MAGKDAADCAVIIRDAAKRVAFDAPSDETLAEVAVKFADGPAGINDCKD